MNRPRMFVTGEPVDGLRSLDAVRDGIRKGDAAKLWAQLVAKVERETADAAWTMDLSEVYDGARSVTRTVVHLLPRTLVVLDVADLETETEISMRWHTPEPPELDADGGFCVEGTAARLAGQVMRLDGEMAVRSGRHAYEAPYNKDGLGEVYAQRHEPFVELAMTGARCRLLSLFCVQNTRQALRRWVREENVWEIETEEGAVRVGLSGGDLMVENVKTGQVWRVGLREQKSNRASARSGRSFES